MKIVKQITLDNGQTVYPDGNLKIGTFYVELNAAIHHSSYLEIKTSDTTSVHINPRKIICYAVEDIEEEKEKYLTKEVK